MQPVPRHNPHIQPYCRARKYLRSDAQWINVPCEVATDLVKESRAAVIDDLDLYRPTSQWVLCSSKDASAGNVVCGISAPKSTRTMDRCMAKKESSVLLHLISMKLCFLLIITTAGLLSLRFMKNNPLGPF